MKLLISVKYWVKLRSLQKMVLLQVKPCTNWSQSFRRMSLIRKTYEPETKKGMGAFGYFLGLFPLTAFCLGTWQVKRREWKLALIQQMEDRIKLAPTQLPHDLEEIDKMEYQRVIVRGHFEHSKEMYIQPRSLISGNQTDHGGSLMSSGQVGSWVITPFVLADREWTILVNRGWVPRNKTRPQQREEKLINDQVDLVGVVRLTEKRVPLGTRHLTSDGIRWSRRDLQAMSAAADSKPVFIDAVKESSQPGGPIGGQTRTNLRNEHLSYIITWYSLATITALLWYKKCLKKPG